VNESIIHGIVRNGTVILDRPPPFADGTPVTVTFGATEPGNAANVLAALSRTKPIPADWMDEFERLITEGQRPPASILPF
jgi:hypothetical protein